MEIKAIYRALTDCGVECAVALKPAFQDIFLKGIELPPPIYEMPQREIVAINEMFYRDFATFQGMDDINYINTIIDSEVRAVKAFQAEAIVSVLQPTASISARRMGIPHLAYARWTEHSRFTSPVYKRFGESEMPPPSKATVCCNDVLRTTGLPEVKDFWDLSFMYSDIKFVPGPPELEPELESERGVVFLGFIEGILDKGNANHESEDQNSTPFGDHHILVYLSSKEFELSEVCSVIDKALSGSKYHATIALGNRNCHVDSRLNSHQIQVKGWINIADEITSAKAIITVGTRTSALQALLAGIGNIIIPGGDDELTFNAMRLTELGVAYSIPKTELNPDNMREAIETATGLTMRSCAKSLGMRMRLCGGPPTLAKLLGKYES